MSPGMMVVGGIAGAAVGVAVAAIPLARWMKKREVETGARCVSPAARVSRSPIFYPRCTVWQTTRITLGQMRLAARGGLGSRSTFRVVDGLCLHRIAFRRHRRWRHGGCRRCRYGTRCLCGISLPERPVGNGRQGPVQYERWRCRQPVAGAVRVSGALARTAARLSYGAPAAA